MNRSRTIERDFAAEGSDRSLQLATALAQVADPELLEAILHNISLLHEWGGEVYIGAARDRFQAQDGRLVKVERGGTFLTYAHVVGYNKVARIKGQPVEPDAQYEQTSAPDVAESPNGAEPEPVAATGE